MAQSGEIYTAYEWHAIDPEAGKVIVYMQNRRDHPSGSGVIDFPCVTVLDYARNGKRQGEGGLGRVPGGAAPAQEYAEACARFDPKHRAKQTRLSWGNGPAWTKGA